jgi:hypothetical protein
LERKGSEMTSKLLDNQNIDRDFVDQLSEKELSILRAVVKRVHMKYYPEDMYTDAMADMLISKFGAEYGEKVIKKAIDSGLFN